MDFHAPPWGPYLMSEVAHTQTAGIYIDTSRYSITTFPKTAGIYKDTATSGRNSPPLSVSPARRDGPPRLGELSDQGGVLRLAPRDWPRLTGSFRLAPLDWLRWTVSFRLAPLDWLRLTGSLGWFARLALAPLGWLWLSARALLTPHA